jgi:RNA polymerase sigma-70 factor (ECF subfamily)
VPEPTDLAELVRGARAGDEWAISQLFRALHPQLLHYIRHHVPDGAEDIASETWLAAARGLPAFEGDGSDFRGWLFTIAHRRVVDYYRASARRPPPTSLGDSQPNAAPDPADLVLEELSTDEAIASLVRCLPPDQAEVVLLRVVAGLDVEHVASAMGRSTGAVRVLQHRALRRLAKTWQPRPVTR